MEIHVYYLFLIQEKMGGLGSVIEIDESFLFKVNGLKPQLLD
jgi:hypothetical protein